MRVALACNMPQETSRSIRVYAEHLIPALRQVDPELDLVEVRVQAWRWPSLSLPMPYGRAASLRTLGLYLSRWVRYPLALRRVRADVYHVLDTSYGHLTWFLPRTRTVVTYHGGGSGLPARLREWHPAGPALWLYDLAFRGMLRAGRIVAVSEFCRQELAVGAGYPLARIDVAPHGVDTRFRPPSPAAQEALRSQLLAPGERHLALHVGHGAARKNVEALYRALALLRRDGCPVRLLRIGAAPTPAQSRLIEALGVAGAITHLPHVANPDLPAFYGAADVFVFPALYEGFGLPLIEAMACGAPVVCSDSPLFREVCGPAACYADARRPEALAAAMAGLLGDAALAEGCRARGLARAQLFTWERAARATLEAYRKMEAEWPAR